MSRTGLGNSASSQVSLNLLPFSVLRSYDRKADNHREHLDRNHRLPISCLRCYAAFESERDRDAHMRSPEQCMLQPQPPYIDGFNASQRNEFKCRPKGYNLMTEEQKWRHVYLILFPDTEEQDVPSPCKLHQARMICPDSHRTDACLMHARKTPRFMRR